MTFTYTTPPTTDNDRVRFWSTDTVERPYSVSDEDIAFLIAEYPTSPIEFIASIVADRIADYWATSSSAAAGIKRVGPFQEMQRDGAALEAAWRARAARLRSGVSNGLAVIGGGVSVFTGDTDPEFSIGMTDFEYQSFPVRQGRPATGNGVYG